MRPTTPVSRTETLMTSVARMRSERNRLSRVFEKRRRCPCQIRLIVRRSDCSILLSIFRTVLGTVRLRLLLVFNLERNCIDLYCMHRYKCQSVIDELSLSSGTESILGHGQNQCPNMDTIPWFCCNEIRPTVLNIQLHTFCLSVQCVRCWC